MVVEMLLEQEEEETLAAKFRIRARPGNNGGRGQLCEEEKMKPRAAYKCTIPRAQTHEMNRLARLL
jgi:hypothetical protein